MVRPFLSQRHWLGVPQPLTHNRHNKRCLQVQFQNCSATEAAGALAVQGAQVVIVQSTLTGCMAPQGGAVAVTEWFGKPSLLTIQEVGSELADVLLG